jgi:YesN/AraC family two-component response regulator
VTTDRKYMNGIFSMIHNKNNSTTKLQQYLAQQRKVRENICVLIIEEQIFVRQILIDILKTKRGYDVIVAKNASQGLALFMENAPDIVFMDLDLPNQSGYELLFKLQKLDQNPFIIALSEYSSLENVQKTINIGAVGFVAKPFTESKIEVYINSYITKYQERLEQV